MTPEPRALVEALIEVGRSAVARGLVVGSGGNLSAREPGSREFVITRAGTWFDRLNQDSFARVRLDDAAVIGGERPSTEVDMHLAAYRARPDVNAVVHLHPQISVLLDALGQPIRLVTTDHAVYVRRIARAAYFPPGTPELADAVAAALAGAEPVNCVLMPHHGCCVVGHDVAMAWRRAANLEEAALLTYRALLLTGTIGGLDIPECPPVYHA
jgi:L-fuculose-phosphate aldolase